MIGLYFQVAFGLHGLLQRHAPTNTLLRAVRARTGSPWLPVATLLVGVGYFCATRTCVAIVESGGPGWMNLLVLLFGWNAIKLGISGTTGTGMQAWASLRAKASA
ncbi:hypothetical protein AFL01nite_02480 [Aeromicrobium flavum]|uniref:Sulfate permease n=1 Tax=Aeromicrobium flavum TaxID=416568 RepID=A0A512HR44_9ACTN|nr:hypothetical protein [Aeromicrobium flavum]GEO87921.1 hypothetical protein AFL01nite_02480 [Aeromicrobium flavum]